MTANKRLLSALFFYRIINNLLNVGTYIHFREFLVLGIGINAVRQENINNAIFRIGPGISSGKTGMSETFVRSIAAGWSGLADIEHRFIKAKGTAVAGKQKLGAGKQIDRGCIEITYTSIISFVEQHLH